MPRSFAVLLHVVSVVYDCKHITLRWCFVQVSGVSVSSGRHDCQNWVAVALSCGITSSISRKVEMKLMVIVVSLSSAME